MKNNNGWTGLCTALTLCLAGVASPQRASAAETEPGTWEVVIEVFSGRTHPVFKLEDSEIARVKGFLSQASSVSGEKDKAKVFRASVLAYTGLVIRQRGKDQVLLSETRVRGKDILVQSGTSSSWRSANDSSLEQFLVDLALDKGSISQQVHDMLRKDMEKR